MNINQFKKKLYPQLIKLEKSRRYRNILYSTSYLIYLIPISILLGTFPFEEEKKSFVPLIGMISSLILFFLIEPFLLSPQKKSYKKNFNQLILAKFVTTLFPELSYFPDKYFDKNTFKYSKLYRNRHWIQSIGSFEGLTKSNLKFKFTKLRSSEALDRKLNLPPFNGLFYMLEIPNISFPYILILGANKSEFLDDEHFKLKQIPIARMNASLNKMCTIYSEVEKDAYTIIQMNFIKELERIYKELTSSFTICFYDNKMYIALEKLDFFEVKLRAPLVSNSLISKLYKDISQSIDLINSISRHFLNFDNINFKGLSKNNDDDLLYDHLIL